MLPVVDMDSKESGTVKVTIEMRDAAKFTYDDTFQETTKILSSQRMLQDVILKIVNKLAEAEFEEFDILLDMLFAKDHTNMTRVTKHNLMDWIITDMGVHFASRKDLELFTKTHPSLAGRQEFTRAELKNVFERPFRDARQRMVIAEAQAPRKMLFG